MNSNLLYENDLVNISGTCNPTDVRVVISQYPYWYQMNIPEQLTIPPLKPDMEQINSVDISVNIMRSEVIKVPASPLDASGNYISNLEGKISTGRKLIIEGQLCQKISYTADEDEQSTHSAHFYVPFSAYIVVPEEISFNNGQVIKDSLNVNFQVNTCIEDVTVKMLNPRTILKEVTLLLYAVPNQ